MQLPTLSDTIFSFFKKLEKNNNRDWFEEHKKEFKALESDVKKFYNALLEKLRKHDDIDKLKLFRIYRDIRFSTDKTPYKTHFGGAFHRKKPELRGGYYLHIAPGDSFIATGFWEPDKDDLFRIRKEFEMDAGEIRKILADKKVNSIWGGFVGDEVKTAPKGFSKDDPNIDLIKRKQYIFIRKFTDEQVLANDFISEVDEAFKAIRPFFDYMSEVLTTNLNGEPLI